MAVRFRGGAWWAFACYKGRRRAARCSSRAEAAAVHDALLRELGKPDGPAAPACAPTPHTMAGLCQLAIALDWKGKPSRHRPARLCVDHLGHDRHPGTVSMEVLDDLVVVLQGQGLASSTIRNRLSAIRVMLERAQRLRVIDTLPTFPEARILPLPEPRELTVRPEWHQAVLLELERREMRAERRMVIVLWELGLRRSEAADLTWDRVDLVKGEVLVAKTKGKRARRLPLPGPAWDALMEQHACTGDQPRVWPWRGQTFYRHYIEAKDTVCDQLGLGPDVRKEWCVHSLRHTCLTRLAEAGWSGPQLQAWAGHGNMATTQRYVHAHVDFRSLLGC